MATPIARPRTISFTTPTAPAAAAAAASGGDGDGASPLAPADSVSAGIDESASVAPSARTSGGGVRVGGGRLTVSALATPQLGPSAAGTGTATPAVLTRSSSMSSAAMRRAVSHLATVHSTLLSASMPPEERAAAELERAAHAHQQSLALVESGAPDGAAAAAASASAFAAAAASSSMAGAMKRLGDELGPTRRHRPPVNPFANLRGARMMAAAKAYSAATFAENTSAALLSVPIPERSLTTQTTSKAGRALAAAAARNAARSALPSVEALVARQEFVRERLQERWTEAAAQVAEAERHERALRALVLGETDPLSHAAAEVEAAAAAASAATAAAAAQAEEKESLPAATPQVPVAATKGAMQLQPQPVARGSTRASAAPSKRASLVTPAGDGPAVTAPALASTAATAAQSRRASATPNRRDTLTLTLTAPADGTVVVIPAADPAGAGSGPSSEAAEPESAGGGDSELDPRWARGAHGSLYRSWLKAEIKALSQTAYDNYLAESRRALEAERERLENGGGAQYATAPSAGPGAKAAHVGTGSASAASQSLLPQTQVTPNPLLARTLAVHDTWSNRLPPVLQARHYGDDDDGGAPDSGVFDGPLLDSNGDPLTPGSKGYAAAAAAAARSRRFRQTNKGAHNPVLVPVIERKLMDLSRPLRELMAQIDREERGEDALDADANTSATAHDDDDEDAEDAEADDNHEAGADASDPAAATAGGASATASATSRRSRNPRGRRRRRALSPRSLYNESQRVLLKNLVALLMQLDESVLQAIRAEFAAMDSRSDAAGTGQGKGLVIYEFVLMLCTHIGMGAAAASSALAPSPAASVAATAAPASASTALVPLSSSATALTVAPGGGVGGLSRRSVTGAADMAALLSMFREVDVDSNNVMEWSEFTSHLVQLASTYGADTGLQSAPHFVPVQVPSQEDQSLHSRPCELVHWFGGSGVPGTPGLQKLVLIERNSRLVKVYDTDLSLLRSHRCRAAVLAVEYLPPRHQVIVSCADRSIQFFSVRKSPIHWTLEFTWQVAASQTCMEYAGKGNMAAAAGGSSAGAGGDAAGAAAASNAAKKRGGAGGGGAGGSSGGKGGSGSQSADSAPGASSPALNFNLLYTGAHAAPAPLQCDAHFAGVRLAAVAVCGAHQCTRV